MYNKYVEHNLGMFPSEIVNVFIHSSVCHGAKGRCTPEIRHADYSSRSVNSSLPGPKDDKKLTSKGKSVDCVLDGESIVIKNKNQMN